MSYRIRSISGAGAGPALDTAKLPESRVLRTSIVPTSIVRYVYYAFIFSLPFESADIDIGGIT